MALTRALSFPLSGSEEVARELPFDIESQDAARLGSCEAFRSIRQLLDCQNNNVFCHSHQHIQHGEQEAWLLQRDITFALVSPILEVYRNAAELALTMLGNRNPCDLELVFRGEARGTFSWLQCFVVIESEWCHAEGCPACIVSHVLESEPTIRMVIAACRLASCVRQPLEDPHSIPIFDFWTSSLFRALQEDTFWSRESWITIGDRAKNLEKGIYAMAQQCCELERMPSPTSSDSECSPPASPTASGSPKRLGTYRNINGQLKFVSDENVWMQNIVLGCWTTLLADAKHQQSRKMAEGKSAGPSRPQSAVRSSSL